MWALCKWHMYVGMIQFDLCMRKSSVTQREPFMSGTESLRTDSIELYNDRSMIISIEY